MNIIAGILEIEEELDINLVEAEGEIHLLADPLVTVDLGEVVEEDILVIIIMDLLVVHMEVMVSPSTQKQKMGLIRLDGIMYLMME